MMAFLTHLCDKRVLQRLPLVIAAVGLAALLGAARLTYHEAIWAQSAREMIASEAVLVPTLDARPWLEKPPLGTWLIAVLGVVCGGVSETVARVPSVIAALLLCGTVAGIAARRIGARVGWSAGLIQGTTFWTIHHGRLAEADILLAALIAGAFGALDRVRMGEIRAVWLFWALFGMTALVKGVGFGAVLVAATTLVVLVWDRDGRTCKVLLDVPGLILGAVIALAWPVFVLMRHPESLRLWMMHVGDRLAAHPTQFAGEKWPEYLVSPLWQTLPWTPLALLGAWGTRGKRFLTPFSRLLWAWSVVPAVLVSLASVRNTHYLIHALPPWSIAAALGWERLRRWRGKSFPRSQARLVLVGILLAIAYAVGFGILVPKFDRRAPEADFYRSVGKRAATNRPLVILYDDWDRLPYPSPFGPMPHDLALRLYYLNRPAQWRSDLEDLQSRPLEPPFTAIGRERDRKALEKLGRVEVILRGPTGRARMSKVDDRTYVLFQVLLFKRTFP